MSSKNVLTPIQLCTIVPRQVPLPTYAPSDTCPSERSSDTYFSVVLLHEFQKWTYLFLHSTCSDKCPLQQMPPSDTCPSERTRSDTIIFQWSYYMSSKNVLTMYNCAMTNALSDTCPSERTCSDTIIFQWSLVLLHEFQKCSYLFLLSTCSDKCPLLTHAPLKELALTLLFFSGPITWVPKMYLYTYFTTTK